MTKENLTKLISFKTLYLALLTFVVLHLVLLVFHSLFDLPNPSLENLL